MDNQKVVWSEGMFMQPHHFQQWDRYYENELKFRLNTFIPYAWGVSHLEIDKEALANGTFSLLSFKGVLSDGLSINIPECDTPPRMRDVKKSFPASSDILEVVLAIPSVKRGKQVCRMADDTDESKKTRLEQTFIAVQDENGGVSECQIPVSKKRFEIRFANESLDDYTWIKIAEVIRSQTGSYSLHQEFIAPSTSISSCQYLLNLTGRIFEKLVGKSNSLRERRGQKSIDVAEFGVADVTNLWMLYTINSCIPALKYMLETKSGHPERLYLLLTQLFGQLTTFSHSISAKDIPPYKHENLRETFKELEEKLNGLTEIVSSTKFVPIPLNKVRELLYAGQIIDENIVDKANLFLAIGGNIPAEEILAKIPRMIKISSRDNIDLILSANMQGLIVSHEQRVPSAIPVKMGTQYFSLKTYGGIWDGIRESRTIAIALPSGFSDCHIELIAVKA
jgi:type VI secretion system protein ImpJ